MNTFWERPTRDGHWPGDFQTNVSQYVLWLSNCLEQVGIVPSTVQSSLELGPGTGRITRAQLTAFPYATIHTIDYYADDMGRDLQDNPRIVRHRGLFVDVLGTVWLPQPQITILSYSSYTHGFNAGNIHLLVNAIGSGVLITDGDNGNLEYSDFFHQRFQAIWKDDPTALWRIR